eukprot:1192810-Prorocentrum_minimum.AAC.5
MGSSKVMHSNGVTHMVVRDDLSGVGCILKWLSYIPAKKGAAPHSVARVKVPYQGGLPRGANRNSRNNRNNRNSPDLNSSRSCPSLAPCLHTPPTLFSFVRPNYAADKRARFSFDGRYKKLSPPGLLARGPFFVTRCVCTQPPGAPLPCLPTHDPVERPLVFYPPRHPHDPRQWLEDFFDRGSFMETMADWGKTVVTGRAALGGLPIGALTLKP